MRQVLNKQFRMVENFKEEKRTKNVGPKELLSFLKLKCSAFTLSAVGYF